MAERMAFGQEYMVPAEFARKLERERNELLAYLDAAHYGTCNAELRRDRDEARAWAEKARELVEQMHAAFEGRSADAWRWYSTEASDIRDAALEFLYPEQFK